jgi:hypothetical protein
MSPTFLRAQIEVLGQRHHCLLGSFENLDEVGFLLAASLGPRKVNPLVLIKVDALHISSIPPDQEFALRGGLQPSTAVQR